MEKQEEENKDDDEMISLIFSPRRRFPRGK